MKTHRNGVGDATPPQPGDDVLDGLFRSARADAFTAPQAAVLWSRVGAATAVGASAGSAAHAGGSGAAAGGTTLKAAATWLLGGTLVMASAGLTTVGVAGRALPNPDAPSPAAAVAASEPAPPANARPTVVDDHGPAVPEVEPGSPRVMRSAPVVAEAPKVRLESPARAEAPANRTPDVAPSRSTSTAPRADAVSASRSSVTSPGGVNAPVQIVGSPPSATEASASEGALLLRARRVLASDPAEALELTRQHARQFPTGALIPEREVLAIEALAGLGRTAEARAQLAAFRQQFPASPHLARLQALLSK